MLTIEYTDMFGGEANYSWVRRYYHIPPRSLSHRECVRIAKAACGLTGVRCATSKYGSDIRIIPRGTATVLFISYEEYDADAASYWRSQVDRNGNPI